MQESCFIANAKLTQTKEKPYQSQSTLKQNKAIFSKVYVYHEPCFIANATSIHTKEKPYQSQSTLKRNKAIFYEFRFIPCKNLVL